MAEQEWKHPARQGHLQGNGHKVTQSYPFHQIGKNLQSAYCTFT